jgi:iron complex transport system substrate-binding protein
VKRVALALLVVLAGVGTTTAATDADVQAVECEFPITVTDATGAEVTVEAEPERVVVLGPSTAQTMWEIGAREKVVGMPVNQYTAYLNGSESKAHVVNDLGQPVQERVVNQSADLVLAPNIIQNDTIESLRDAEQTVYRFEAATTLEDVYAKTELTGRLVGEFENASGVSAEMRATVEAVRSAVADEPRPRVYYPLGGGYTAGSGTYIDDVIAAAGGGNIAADAGISGYKTISQEEITARNPEWVVLGGLPSPPANPAVNGSTAVAQEQVLSVDANYLNQPGPRTVGPLVAMAEAFHPDAMADVDTENVEALDPTECRAAGGSTASPADGSPSDPAGGSGETAGSTVDVTGSVTASLQSSDPTPTSTAGDTGTGFTVGMVVLAVAVLALAARREL